MKIKRLLVGIVLAAAAVFAGCSENAEQSAEDAALQQELIGVWFYPDSAQYDEDGDLTSFSAYQFTENVVKCHDVTDTQIMSYALDEYTIKDGKIIVDNDGQKQYALISIENVDGTDHLYWDIDTKTMEFTRMTDEEIEEYSIPADKMLSGEADLLGIETTAETEAASETSAASE